MKTLKTFSLMLVVLAFLLGLSAMAAAAEEPVLVTNANPGGASYIDGQAHPIAANGSLWYRFDYNLSSSGRPQMTTLKLLYGNASGVGFELYEPMDMNAYADGGLKPVIGRGMPSGDDLVWYGALGAGGAYYVRVLNTNPFATTALLSIQGNGITSAPIAVTGVSAVAKSTATMDDPAKSVIFDGKPQTVAAQSALWYRFDYSATDVKTIRLVYGAKSGLEFEVYSPEILGSWWTNKPIGIGTVERVVCSTGLCATDDLTWVGAFGASGTYYARVINDSANDAPVLLTIQ